MIDADDDDYKKVVVLLHRYDPGRGSELEHVLERAGYRLVRNKKTLDEVMDEMMILARNEGYIATIKLEDPTTAAKVGKKKVRKR